MEHGTYLVMSELTNSPRNCWHSGEFASRDATVDVMGSDSAISVTVAAEAILWPRDRGGFLAAHRDRGSFRVTMLLALRLPDVDPVLRARTSTHKRLSVQLDPRSEGSVSRDQSSSITNHSYTESIAL
jgi:hypothetical protein